MNLHRVPAWSSTANWSKDVVNEKNSSMRFLFRKENKSITFSDRLTLINDKTKLVPVKNVINHKILLTT